jgi:HPt (histidine-containing phosphotransfer) domain-containing protein
MPNKTEVAVLDMDQLRDICMEDQDLMRELVTALIDDAKAQIPALEKAVENADAKSCARLAHYVKGACANVGAVSMATILKNIEQSAGEGDFNACRTSLNNLALELRKFSVEAASI